MGEEFKLKDKKNESWKNFNLPTEIYSLLNNSPAITIPESRKELLQLSLGSSQAKEFNVDGIGLCRTEHMFFEKNSLQIMQKILLSLNLDEKLSAIEDNGEEINPCSESEDIHQDLLKIKFWNHFG